MSVILAAILLLLATLMSQGINTYLFADYFKGEEKKLLSVVDSIFASGYLTADGQGIKDTIRTITDAGFTYEIESA